MKGKLSPAVVVAIIIVALIVVAVVYKFALGGKTTKEGPNKEKTIGPQGQKGLQSGPGQGGSGKGAPAQPSDGG